MSHLVGGVFAVVAGLATTANAQTFIVEALGQNSASYQEVSGTWATSASCSSAGGTPDRNSRYASTAQAVAMWTFVPATSDVYDVRITLPGTTNVTASSVTYTVTSEAAPLVVNVDQNNGGGANDQWLKVNSEPLPMLAGVAYTVTQTENTSRGLPCQRADAVRWDVPHIEPPPRFRPGHTLPPLSMWQGRELSFELRKELADDWGYALSFGFLRSEQVSELADPNSTVSRICDLAAADPDKYPMQVSITPAYSVLLHSDEYPAETWCRDAQSQYILDDEGERVWSPEAPDATSEMIEQYENALLQAVLARAPIAILTNGGEYGLSVCGHDCDYWAQDPVVMATKGAASWEDYISVSKARQEQIVTDAMRALLPERELYIYYTTSGNKYRNAIASWDMWGWDYGVMRTISDIPNTSSYYEWHNDGFTGDLNMLSLMLNGVAENFIYGDMFSYNWVSAGWPGPDQPPMADPDCYEGFLKCCYMTGMIGGVAGYFAYDDPLDWIWQYRRLGKVHALFSWLEPFVRASDLLPGPDGNQWNPDRPAYEFPTGDEDARVLARKHNGRNEWLIAAWAADGDARSVSVTVPVLGTVTVEARPEATLYRAFLQQGKPVLLSLRFATASADFDTDGDVDISDFGVFAACFNGPNRPPTGACATTADFDVDGDIDLTDFSAFAACFNGPNRPPACE